MPKSVVVGRRSASLKALDSRAHLRGGSACAETATSVGSTQWKTTARDRPTVARKSISLKFSKGASPSASRSNSGGPTLDRWTLGNRAEREGGSLPPYRPELAAGAGDARAAAGRVASSRISPVFHGEELSLPVPVAVIRSSPTSISGRPPLAPSQSRGGSSPSGPPRAGSCQPTPDVDAPQHKKRVSSHNSEPRTGVASSNNSMSRAWQYPSTGMQTTTPETVGGFMYRSLSHMPSSPRVCGRVPGLPLNTKRPFSAAHPSRIPCSDPLPEQQMSLQELVGRSIAPPIPPTSRFGWVVQSTEEEDSEVPEFETEMRRELLACHLMGRQEEASTVAIAETGDHEAGIQGLRAVGDVEHWAVASSMAQKTLEDVELSLIEAAKRAEMQRFELNNFLKELQARTFKVNLDSTELTEKTADVPRVKEESLVSLPPDFDDIVDLNVQFAVSKRRQQRQGNSCKIDSSNCSKSRCCTKGADNNLETDGLIPPSFLQKYFSEGMAIEELPHLQSEAKIEKWGEQTRTDEAELLQNMRQIARLDDILAACETAGKARVQAGLAELEATKARLKKDKEQQQKSKFAVLQAIKDLRQQNAFPSKCSSLHGQSAVASAKRSTSIISSSATVLSVSKPGMELVDWSAWSSTASVEVATVPRQGTLCVDDKNEDSHVVEEFGEEEDDMGTFALTCVATQQPLSATFRKCASPQRTHTRSAGGVAGAVTMSDLPAVHESLDDKVDSVVILEVEPHEDHPFLVEESVCEPLHRIDERLRELVPENEWEFKSILSFNFYPGEISCTSRSARSPQGNSTSGSSTPWEKIDLKTAEMTLGGINDRTHDICAADEMDVPTSQFLKPRVLQKLLLEAARDTKMNNTERKAPLSCPCSAFAENTCLLEAKNILKDIAATCRANDAAFEDDQLSVRKFELDISNFQSNVAVALSPKRQSSLATDGLASRLEELGKEALSIAERGKPREEMIQKIRKEYEQSMTGHLLPLLHLADMGSDIDSLDNEDLPSLLSSDGVAHADDDFAYQVEELT